MQEFGLIILHDADQMSTFVKEQGELSDRLKIALISNDPLRLPDMYPQFAAVKEDNTAAIKALDSDQPVEVKTVMTADEALNFLEHMTLSIDDLVVGEY